MTINKIYQDLPVYEFLDNGRVLHFHFSTSGKPDRNADYRFDVRNLDMDLQRVYHDRCAIVGSIEPFNRELWYELIKPTISKAIQSGQITVPAGEHCEGNSIRSNYRSRRRTLCLKLSLHLTF